MNSTRKVFDPRVWSLIEQDCRRAVAHDPVDMTARVRLAWCLLLQALHQSGRESLLTTHAATGETRGDHACVPSCRTQEDACRLLEDSLYQAMIVAQLSPRPQDISDVKRLQALVAMSGEEQVVQETDRQGERILAAITSDLLAR